jgi:hypothetical protein
MNPIIRTLAIALSVAALGFPQARRLQHYDGTVEFTSRGNFGVLPGTAMQRIPWDQAAGATAVLETVAIIQDQAAATPEAITLEVRANDPFGPPTGAPDMAAPGLLGALGPFMVAFPGVGISAVEITFVVPAGGIPLPAAVGVPAGDWYLGLAFGASPAWPMDGISTQISATAGGAVGEQMNPLPVGYTGVAGVAGLGWTFNAATGVLGLGTGNRSWLIGGRYDKDVVQPYASNPVAFTASGMVPAGVGDGADPNFGYTGIFPDVARFGFAGSDMLGFRVRTTAPVGTPTALILTTVLFPGPVVLPGILDPASSALFVDVTSASTFTLDFGAGTVPAPAGEPAGLSDAWWGPFPLPPFFVGVTAYVQAVVFPPLPTISLSTMCRVTV